MTSGDGKEILPSIWDSKRTHSQLRKYRWPSQGQPTEIEWKIWRTVQLLPLYFFLTATTSVSFT